MTWAAERGLLFDAFVLITDDEAWAGDRHPAQALAAYRRKTGIPAKLVSVAMASNAFSVADPRDALQLDVVGFDPSVSAVVADFLRG
jgi:60 kDa SS-A/Ro ribonucleoprotein